MSLVFRRFLSRRLIEQARTAAEKATWGKWKGTPRWTCRSPRTEGRFGSECARPKASRRRLTISRGLGGGRPRVFGGLLIAGALAAWVPNSFWQSFFLAHHAALSKFWGR